MNEFDRLDKHSQNTLRYVIVIIILLYVGFAFLPRYIVKGGFLANYSVDESLKYKEVLSRLGTFGDSFGALNAMMTSLALAGLFYTAYLQRKQMEDQYNEKTKSHKKDRILRLAELRRDRMNVASYLAQNYFAEYVADTQLHDAQYVAESERLANLIIPEGTTSQDAFQLRRNHSVKARAMHYREQLEHEYRNINRIAFEDMKEQVQEMPPKNRPTLLIPPRDF
jgi:hypothetical protein